MEWNCSFGQTVVLLNTDTGRFKQAVTDSDSHFLAWAPDGESFYLKVDTIDHPQVLRLHLNGNRDILPVTELTYDLAPAPGGGGFISSFSRGMDFGSEMDMAQTDGHNVKQLMADPQFYLSFVRWSPDGKQIATFVQGDTSIDLWDAKTGKNRANFINKKAINSIDWSPDGKYLAIGSNGGVTIWSPE